MRPTQLAAFYPDLNDPKLAVPVRDLPPALLHEHGAQLGSRRSRSACSVTTARSTRSKGNIAWMRAHAQRAKGLEDWSSHPPLDVSGSDSALLDNALELLVRAGKDVTPRQ